MDIEEIKKYAKNKIEGGELTKQVRQRIKETTWDKQNLREGFSETFKPLISQFEEPEDPKRKNIFTQNQEMLQNQLALTEDIKTNQKAITDGFRLFEKLANMEQQKLEKGKDEEEDEEKDEDEEAQAPIEQKEDKTQITITKDYFDRFLLNKKSQDILIENDFNILPSYYFDKNTDIKELDKLIGTVKSDLEGLHDQLKNIANFPTNKKGYLIAVSTATKKGPTVKTQEKIETFNVLSIYLKNLIDLLEFRNQTGSGMFYSNPQELLNRFELLNGSLAAGNNGVLPEFIQIAHRLRDLGIITNKQLSTLLKKVI